MPFDSAEFDRFTSFLKEIIEKYGAEVLSDIKEEECDIKSVDITE